MSDKVLFKRKSTGHLTKNVSINNKMHVSEPKTTSNCNFAHYGETFFLLKQSGSQ